MVTDYPTKIYCSEKCAKAARFERDESYYDFPHLPDAEPIFSFQCKNCGKTVLVYSKYDQRTTFCCGICAKQYQRARERRRLAKQRYTSNIGMSGGMSLGSLIARETRSVDRAEKVIELKTCPTCGKKFEVDKNHQNFCSEICKIEHEKANTPKTRTCPYCGKDFSPSHPLQKYCSITCKKRRRESAKRNSLIKEVITRTCPVCNKIFNIDNTQHRRVYCSDKCKNFLNYQHRKAKKNG